MRKIVIFIALLASFLIAGITASASVSNILLNVGETSESVHISWKNDIGDDFDKLMTIEIKDDCILLDSTKVFEVAPKIISYDSGDKLYTYEVELSNLNDSTTYIYKIYNSKEHTNYKIFTTLEDNDDIVLGFIGDIQGYKQSQYYDYRKVYEKLLEIDNLDITLYAGDIVDKPDSFDQWSYFDKAMGDYLSGTLSAAAIGNHDNSNIFTSTFSSPENGLSELRNRNYFFEYRNVIVAVLDTESPDLLDEQSVWLSEVMKDKDKFKLILMHRSSYPISYNEVWIRKLNESFEENDIDLVLSGHDHIYSRTTISSGKKVDLDSGVTYVVGGSGSGSKFYNEEVDRPWSNIVYDDNNPVASIIRITDDTLTFEAYAFIDDEMILIDKFIKKEIIDYMGYNDIKQ